MPYSENSTIAAIDDGGGARSAIRGAVDVLLARLRLELTDDDVREFAIILAAADRLHEYHLQIRAEVSRIEQAKKGHV